MGEINDVLCEYLGIPEYNADFWNGTEFIEKRPILASQLVRCDREYYKTNQTKSTSIRRDVLTYHKAIPRIRLGIEILDTIDYTIPVRIMDYDAQELKRQIKDIARQNRKVSETNPHFWKHSGEYLYGMRKEDRLLPTHTVALYCGYDDFDGAQSTLDLIDTDTINSDIYKILKNYPMHIYSLKDLAEENFQTSLREVVAIFKRSSNKNTMKKYYLAHRDRFCQLDDITLRVIGALIGHHNLKLFIDEKGELNMCKAFEDERNEGREEGICFSLKNLISNLKWSAEQAMDALGIPLEERGKYLSML